MSPDAQIEQTAEVIRHLVAEIARLARTDTPRQAFFTEFLTRAVRAIDAAGGAVWIGREGRFNLIADVDLASSQFGTNPRQQESIRAAIRWVQEHGRSLIIAPMGPDWGDDQQASGIPNTTPMPSFYVPIKASGKVVGVVQVWQRPGRDPKNFRAFVEFLIQVTLYAESYLESRQLETVVRETQRLEQLLLVTERAASSRSAEELALQVVNLGRELASADRLTLLALRGDQCHALAVSGQAKVERRSEMVRAIEQVGQTAVASRDTRAFRRPAPGEQAPQDALRYFASSSHEMVVAIPLRHGDAPVGVLVAEYAATDGQPNDADLAGLESLARQVGPAFGQRLSAERLPLRRTAHLLARLRPRGGKRHKVVLAAGAAGIRAAAVLPLQISIEGRCTVWPTGRAAVVAHEGGRIADVMVTEGQQVEPGQPLVRLESPTLSTSLAIARQEVEKLRAEVQRCQASGDPSAARIAAIRADKADGEVAYFEKRIAALTLYAPIAGTVVTPDPQSRLGDVLQRGERVLDLADLSTWEVVVEVPEKEIFGLEQAIDDAADQGGTGVEFILASQRHQVFHARIPSTSQVSPVARPAAGRNVFLVRAVIPEDELNGVQLRVGYEGRARIEGPRKSLLRAATDPFFDYLRMALF